jgi:O-methyltransferase domain/Dimerisation domain
MPDAVTPPGTDHETPRRTLGRMIAGYNTTQLIYVAARLGLADLLAEGPRPSEELARTVEANAAALRRLLRALVEIGVLLEGEDRRFSLTPLGEHLRQAAPGSLWAAAICAGDTFYRAWGDLLESVRTGETAFGRVFGAPMFDYLGRQPELAEIFGRYMTGVSADIAAAVAQHDFSSFRTIVDVGGGHGTLLAAILSANPHAAGVLVDLEPVIPSARRTFEAQGLSHRCELVAGDFFEAVPGGGDAYILKWILHDWDDEQAIRVLRNCRRAMGEKARLLVIETVIPERMTPGSAGAGLDMHMLALTGGWERTESEYRALLDHSGLRLSRVIPTAPSAHSPLYGAIVSIIESVPAGTSTDASPVSPSPER